ncbi:MAG: hypothetical protein Q8N51_14060, partial [Gammaproteobacteria bacterium]|nr:hypothetical protein [Gammaproteobacteria bacterium]
MAYLCCTLGVPIDIRNCMAGAFDYIESLQLTHDDAMPLSVIGGGLVDSYLDGDQPGVDACIHAWRALAHLRSALLAPALLQCLAELYDEGAEDQFAEAPELLGISGLSGIGDLVFCVITEVYPVPVRNVAVRGMLEIARRHPRDRDSVVFSLGHILEEGEIIPPEVNAHIVDALVKLEARDHAEAVERAFAGGCVDYALL